MMLNFQKKRTPAFTLVELIVTLAVLTIGIIMILRTFISISSAFETTTNTFFALWYLEDKIAQLEEDVLKGTLQIDKIGEQGRFFIDGCPLDWKMERGFSDEVLGVEGVLFTVWWKEGNRQRHIFSATYFKKEQQSSSEQ